MGSFVVAPQALRLAPSNFKAHFLRPAPQNLELSKRNCEKKFRAAERSGNAVFNWTSLKQDVFTADRQHSKYQKVRDLRYLSP